MIPFPLDLDIFSPFSSKNNSYANPDGLFFPRTLIIFVDRIALSIRSFPYISKSTSNAYHLIAQSTFHCSLQLPSKILASKSLPLLSNIILFSLFLIYLTGISSTFSVSGHIGKNGKYVFCLSFPNVGIMIFIISLKLFKISISVSLKKPFL